MLYGTVWASGIAAIGLMAISGSVNAGALAPVGASSAAVEPMVELRCAITAHNAIAIASACATGRVALRIRETSRGLRPLEVYLADERRRLPDLGEELQKSQNHRSIQLTVLIARQARRWVAARPGAGSRSPRGQRRSRYPSAPYASGKSAMLRVGKPGTATSPLSCVPSACQPVLDITHLLEAVGRLPRIGDDEPRRRRPDVMRPSARGSRDTGAHGPSTPAPAPSALKTFSS